MFKKIRAEAVLDFMLAFVALLALGIGVVRIWVWFDANYAKRQYAFQKSREIAGIPATYETANIPVDIGRTKEEPGATYQPLDLTEKWVFLGQPDFTVTGEPVGGPLTEVNVAEACKDECAGAENCTYSQVVDGVPQTVFNPNCLCYLHCICTAKINDSIETYSQTIDNQRQTAAQFREAATDLTNQAKKCDDWWEICNIFGGDRTAKELKKAAKDLQAQATGLDNEAAKAENSKCLLGACCAGYNYYNSGTGNFAECTWRAGDDLSGDLTNEAQELCLDQVGGQFNCMSLVKYRIEVLNTELVAINAQIATTTSDLADVTKIINDAVELAAHECAIRCRVICTPSPNYSSCYDLCYSGSGISSCYNCTRNKHCRDKVFNGTDGHACDNECGVCGNSCFDPEQEIPMCCEAINCQGSCTEQSFCSFFSPTAQCARDFCGPCGSPTYEVMKTELQATLTSLNATKDAILYAINNLPACCDKSDPLGQSSCINGLMSATGADI